MNSLEPQLTEPRRHTATDVSSAVADVLAARTDHLFGLMGNGNAHLISHLTSRGFGFTSARHEAATVTMADAYHRATGRTGAATTTYGAGFTNTYTALAEARLARIPLVLVVGEAPTTGGGPPTSTRPPRPPRWGSPPWSPPPETRWRSPTGPSTWPPAPCSRWYWPSPTTAPPPP
ncbi:thiamine pyrophosphate-binding protein [Kocuria sp. CNJ-770]|uniref:thiamine pyrophosphate-binding protein n=1 Tax=Kocuria sp. CNJ-770 TaxID=1904964 RepID=UPI00210130AB|nr:thiamine pyrophosphate-binding protein [Kocuria sp. CNJ-770]